MSSAHRKGKSGRPSSVEMMNIFVSDVEDVAEMVKIRLIARSGTWDVSVGDDGVVYMDRSGASLRSTPLPSEWLVGSYTSRASCARIEEDMKERLAELRATA